MDTGLLDILRLALLARVYLSVDAPEPRWVEASCNTCNEERSGHAQFKQLSLIPYGEQHWSIFEDAVLPFAAPCEPGITHAYSSPFTPSSSSYHVSLSEAALNGWVFQNHLDCKAAAIAGAVNAVHGRTRDVGDQLLNAHDVSLMLDEMSRAQVLSAMQSIHTREPAVDFAKFRDVVRHRLSLEGLDPRDSSLSSTAWDFDGFRESMLPGASDRDDSSNEGVIALRRILMSSHDDVKLLFKALLRLRKLRLPNRETSNSDVYDAITALRVGAQAVQVDEYSWSSLKRCIDEEGCAVLVKLPHHLSLVFGYGQDIDGKHRHVLVGRPSGGQSPCGWIPFSWNDRAEGEVLWRDSVVLGSGEGGIGGDEQYGLTMFESSVVAGAARPAFVMQRSLWMVRAKRGEELDEEVDAALKSLKSWHANGRKSNILDESWLLPDGTRCKRCTAGLEPGDARDAHSKLMEKLKEGLTVHLGVG